MTGAGASGRRRARHGATAAAAAVLLLAGCGTGGSDAGYDEGVERAARQAAGTSPELAELQAAAGLAPCPDTAAPVPGGLPDVVLPCLGGGSEVALAGLSGTPAVVNLWASWCAPCVRELPALQEVGQRAGDRLQVLGVLTQDDARAGLAAAAELGVTFPSVVDADGATKADLGIAPLPATLFVRADGTVAGRYVGPALDAPALTELVARHLGVTV